ncbi:MAG: hypothetical protein ACFFDT_24745 [Candidatus Hodarchaeota archaeon]
MTRFRSLKSLAKEKFNVRFAENKVLTDDSFESELFLEAFKTNQLAVSDFKRGELWPSMVLIEKELSGEKQEHIRVFARAVKKKYDAVIDAELGKSLDEAYKLANHFDVPIFQITTSTNGRRGGVHRLFRQR